MAETKVLAGRAAIVAGGSRGIGRAVAIELARQGASVVVNGRDTTPVQEVVGRIANQGGSALACAGSATDFQFARNLVGACAEHFGAVDVLVNCVGMAEPEGSSILDLAEADWRELLDVHLTSAFNTCRHAAPLMRAQGRGAIINTGSHSFLGMYGGTGYPAGKGGTTSLTLAIAAELAECGVRANVVCPGARTRLSEGTAYENRIQGLHARGILTEGMRDASLAPGEPEEVAPMYAFLASDLAAGITGRIFSAAGGYVGLRELGQESPLGFRNVAADGPWCLEDLAGVMGAVGERA